VKVFRCGDVLSACPAEFQAESEDELFEQIAAHARDDHGIDDVPPEIVDRISAVITER
jgi:predicted small metal-binding protein